MGRFNQFAAASEFPMGGLFRSQREYLLPRFGGHDDGECFTGLQRGSQIAGAPYRASAFVSAALFDPVKDGFYLSPLQNKTCVGTVQVEPQCWNRWIRGDFVLVAPCGHLVRLGYGQRYR